MCSLRRRELQIYIYKNHNWKARINDWEDLLYFVRILKQSYDKLKIPPVLLLNNMEFGDKQLEPLVTDVLALADTVDDAHITLTEIYLAEGKKNESRV